MAWIWHGERATTMSNLKVLQWRNQPGLLVCAIVITSAPHAFPSRIDILWKAYTYGSAQEKCLARPSSHFNPSYILYLIIANFCSHSARSNHLIYFYVVQRIKWAPFVWIEKKAERYSLGQSYEWLIKCSKSSVFFLFMCLTTKLTHRISSAFCIRCCLT